MKGGDELVGNRFELLVEIDFPGRRGGFIRSNDWRLDLFPE